MTTAVSTSLQAAAARVEAGDRDRFVATMAIPASARAALWPLYAVHLELARASWASAEPLVAEMRLQWWVDALGALGTAGQVPDHEFGAALATIPAAIDDLVAIAEARRRECWAEPFADDTALFDHLRDTNGRLTGAAGRLLGASDGEISALGRYGAAAGLAAWFGAVPALLAHARPALPDLKPDAIAQLARRALADVRDADADLRLASRGARFAMMPFWDAKPQLARALRHPDLVCAGSLQGAEVRRRFRLLLRSLRG